MTTIVTSLGVDPHEEVAHPRLADDVEPDGRLVEEQQLGVVEQGGDEVAPHALPEGQLPHRRVEERRHVEQVDERVEVLAVAVLGHPVDPAEQLEGVEEGQVPPQLGALAEHHADAAGEGDPFPLRVDPGHPHPPARREQDAGQHLDRRRLPGPVGPDVADDVALADGQRDAVDGAHLLPATAHPTDPGVADERLRHVLELDDGHAQLPVLR
ncbi:MAG TPA: hypothetical protein VF640_07005 [Acidimicrobiales bacterium]